MSDIGSQVKSSDVKISQALELLNEAAKEKKSEVQELLVNKYAHIKQVIAEGALHGKEALEKAEKYVKEGQEKVKETALEVDKRVRANPWPYIGGVAVVSIFIGYLMGSKRK